MVNAPAVISVSRWESSARPFHKLESWCGQEKHYTADNTCFHTCFIVKSELVILHSCDHPLQHLLVFRRYVFLQTRQNAIAALQQ